MHIFTVARGTLRCCGIGVVQIDVSNRLATDIEVLVVEGNYWGLTCCLD